MIKYFTIEDLLKHYLQKKFHILDLFERKADAHLDEGSASAFFYSLLLSSVLFFNAIPLTTPRR